MIILAAATSTTTNWLDPTVVGIIALSTFFGLWRGLLRSIAGVVGIVLGALFAGRVATYVSPSLDNAHISHPPINAAWAFVIAFLAIVIAVELAANVLRTVQRVMFLGWVDRLGGAAFGAARGILLCMILLAGMAQVDNPQFQAQAKQAQVAVWMWQNLSGLVQLLPKGMQVKDLAAYVAEALSGVPATVASAAGGTPAATAGLSTGGAITAHQGPCPPCVNLQPLGKAVAKVGSSLP